jgi:hypothetical protein
MSVKLLIIAQIARIAEEQLRRSRTLCFCSIPGLTLSATLVARLENELGVDPFNGDEDLEFPVTLGDLVQIYENARK